MAVEVWDFPTFDFERLPRSVDEQPPSFLGMFPPPREGIDFDSLFDRSKDVLSVVVALLFGVGSEDEEEFYDAIPSPKKGGYVKIPAELTRMKKTAYGFGCCILFGSASVENKKMSYN
ncbi:hypothetical protein QQ045_013661 [Rhodiola kirilowii]